MKEKITNNFSKKNKKEKINWLIKKHLDNNNSLRKIIINYWHNDEKVQKIHDQLTENTISNFFLPFGIAPNFLVNNKKYIFPMVTEESSVIAAASKAAKFWYNKGGFKSYVVSKEKIGHIYFYMSIKTKKLKIFFTNKIKKKLIESCNNITKKMILRGGGILNIKLVKKLIKKTKKYFQIEVTFDTCDAMGANFINSCLEKISKKFKKEIINNKFLKTKEKKSLNIIMSILSNYTPKCIAHAEVKCKLKKLGNNEKIFKTKFIKAIEIANFNKFRAVTHNKGIMNGIDSLAIATGNDFRAIEASAHAYANKNGKYKSLTNCEIKKGIFRFWIDIPINIGTTGGVTKIHPLANISLKILKNPNSEKLMQLMAVAGLAQNFAAIYSLITSGIQKGHMKLHYTNIINANKN